MGYRRSRGCFPRVCNVEVDGCAQLKARVRQQRIVQSPTGVADSAPSVPVFIQLTSRQALIYWMQWQDAAFQGAGRECNFTCLRSTSAIFQAEVRSAKHLLAQRLKGTSRIMWNR